MSRRAHKKSRNGCLPCKRRHIRCDEHRPICVNCSAAEIRCSFLGDDSPQIVPAFTKGTAYAPAPSPASSASLIPTTTSTPTPTQTVTTSHQEPLDRYSLNMTHLELFNNLSTREFLSLEEFMQSDRIETAIYIKYALTTPYLMHQLLATSAFHLSIISTELRTFYREHATGFQTRALSLINESNHVLEVTSANCVQMYLFSTLLGVHLLCDTLHYQRDSLEGFIHRYTYCLSVHCGVLAVVKESAHLLHQTEVGPRLTPSHVWERPPPTIDPECEALRGLLDATNVPLSSRQAYQEAVLRLQQVFQAQRDTLETKLRLPLAFAWPAMLPPKYIELLGQQQAEALIILAHYAVLLHRGRHLWMLGDGGRFLIESISGSLDSKWQKYLHVPIAALQEA